MPSPRDLELMYRTLGWLRVLTRPVYLGMEHIPDERPLLFIGNHTMYGIVDTPQLFFELYRTHGILLRAIAERAHKGIPGWWQFIQRMGAVDGSAENDAELLREGECLLIFPGGAREAFKHPEQRYELLWGERRGFACLAVEHGATIVPFAAVGADDVWDVLATREEIFASPIGGILDAARVRRDIVPPIPRGKGPLGLPGIRRQYFQIQPPIRCRDLTPERVRAATEASVKAGIDDLLRYRDQDRYSDWARHAGRWLGERIHRAIERGR